MKKGKKDMVKLDLDKLKSIYIDMAKELVKDDKDCSQYIFNKALEDVSVSLDRLNDLVKYSKERQGKHKIKKKKK